MSRLQKTPMAATDAITILQGWHRVKVIDNGVPHNWCKDTLGFPLSIIWLSLSANGYLRPLSFAPIVNVYTAAKWEREWVPGEDEHTFFFRDARDAVEFKLRFG